MEGLSLDESDSLENMATFLKRNPKLSHVAVHDGKIIGTIKCAQDGRRGYISHMAVAPGYRSYGIARSLYEKSLQELRTQGIWRCNVYVLDSNPGALAFWKHNGWSELEKEFKMLQKKL
jgi:N-acetylglutamate synthase